MANTWQRIKDGIIRKAFHEIVEFFSKQDERVKRVEKVAKTANVVAYDALRAAANTQAALDGQIMSFFQPEPPTADQNPAEGDLWFDTNDGNHIYRYTNGQWIDAQDSKIGEAIIAAQNAQATADGKIVTFYSDTEPTGQAVGDLWFDTANDNKAFRWDGTAWIEVRDQKIIEALNQAQNAQATADGKIVTYYQPNPPTGQAVGDIWFDTDDGNHAYRWNGSAWVDAQDSKIAQAINDAALAQATADSKIVTFYQDEPPTGQAVGDLWVDTNDNNHLYRWNGSAWVSIRDQLVLDGYYNRQKLVEDLQAGVSVVFKDISEFDQTYPSAIAIGNITLNSDGTVAYGSRGVAITKNGLAGYDSNYNGAGDLPSFEIDTDGNATFRGQLGAAGGTFAGELTAATGTFSELQSGDISTNGIKLTNIDILYYRAGSPFRAVKNVQTGFGYNGDTVTISGFYDRAPEIMVSPRSLVVYDSNYSTYSQLLDVSASNLSGDVSTGEWSFQLTATLRVYDPVERHTDLLFDSNGSQFTLGSNFYVFKNTTPTIDITNGIVKYIDFSSFFRFCSTDNRRMRVELYSYIEYITEATGSSIESLQYVGEYEISSWGAVDVNISTRHSGIADSVKELRFGFAIKFLEDLGSAFDDNTNHCIGLETFTITWSETGHSSFCGHSDTNLAVIYDNSEVINPDGQLNWIAIG